MDKNFCAKNEYIQHENIIKYYNSFIWKEENYKKSPKKKI